MAAKPVAGAGAASLEIEHKEKKEVRDEGKEEKKESKRFGGPKKTPMASGVTAKHRELSAALQLLARPERSYYTVDLMAFYEFAGTFDDFIRRQTRRGGWRHRGFYSGVLLYCLGAKLQRVGIATNQIVFDDSELFSVAIVQLPAVVCAMLDQFGEKTDSNDVVIAPRVTQELILVIGTWARNLINPGAADHATSLVLANWRHYLQLCYGDQLYFTVAMSSVASELGVTFSSANTADGLRHAWTAVIAQTRTGAGAADLSGPQYAALIGAGGGAFAAFGPFSGYWATGAAAPGAGGGITAAINNAIVTVQGYYQAAADPIPGGLIGNLRIVNQLLGALEEWQTEEMEIGARFAMRAVPVSHSGSFAPASTSIDEANDTSATSPIRGVTVGEYIWTMILNCHPVFTTRSGGVFNISTPDRRRHRYSTTPVGLSVRELQATLFREGMLKSHKA